MVVPYSLTVMRHYRQPLNQGRLPKPYQKFSGANYSCGDSLTFYLKLDRQKRIKEVAWEGAGCAISQASASIFSEFIKGKTLDLVKKTKSEVLIKKLAVGQLSPLRRKCAILSLYALKGKE